MPLLVAAAVGHRDTAVDCTGRRRRNVKGGLVISWGGGLGNQVWKKRRQCPRRDWPVREPASVVLTSSEASACRDVSYASAPPYLCALLALSSGRSRVLLEKNYFSVSQTNKSTAVHFRQRHDPGYRPRLHLLLRQVSALQGFCTPGGRHRCSLFSPPADSSGGSTNIRRDAGRHHAARLRTMIEMLFVPEMCSAVNLPSDDCADTYLGAAGHYRQD